MPALTKHHQAAHTQNAADEKVTLSRSIVQAETNLLRFPFFALHTKGLREIDFKEVRGSRVESGQTHEFVFRVSRNTDHLFPGPLSRKAHFALLSLLRAQGFPFRNPVAFTWRQLVREMGLAYGGATTINRLKDALQSTLGTMIKSNYALKVGASRESLPTRERGYSLYAECLFTNEAMSDGTVTDRNCVTFADWYIANLNALYAVPIDYAMWNRLNDRSPLSSRLYEFLLFNFSAGIDTFTINYKKLCQFLPAKVESYASKAKEKLGPAMTLILEERIIGDVHWVTGKNDELQLKVTRGDRLTAGAQSPSQKAAQPELFDTVTTTEGTNPLSPTERLVRQFHAAWSGGQERAASPGEVAAARECIDLYGLEVATRLLPKVVRRMRQEFPDAKTFGAARPYFGDIHADHLKKERIAESAKAANLESQLGEEEQRRRTARHQQLEAVWNALPAAEREVIENAVIAANPRLKLPRFPVLLHRFCLDELDKQASVRKGSEPVSGG